MFQIGPLDIDVRVTGTALDASGNPTVPVGHNGATHVVEISSLSTVPLDVEVSGALSANLLVFASGSAWSKTLYIPAFTRASPPAPTVTNEPLNRPVSTGTGNERVRCSRVRRRNHGAAGWGAWHSPTSNNEVVVGVP
jgi:hypothetical protein